MHISAIEHVTKHKVRVFLDGEPAFVISDRELYELDIREDDELDEHRSGKLVQRVERMAAKAAMDLLIKRDYTEANLYQKLRDKGYSEYFAQSGIDYVQSYHYLDDERYARQMVLSKKGTLSRQMMVYKMKQKVLEDDTIKIMLDQESWDDTEAIRRAICKKYGSVSALMACEDQVRERFLQSLMRKGYRYGDIRTVLQNGDIPEDI